MIKGKFPIPPDLSTALDYHRADGDAQLRVAIPGEIITYNPTKRTAEIKILYNRVYNDGTVHPIICPLVDVPVFTLQGGGMHAGFPIGPGDECWVFFADINLDAWHAAGGQQTPLDFRRHDIADGFAFVGPNSLGNPLLTALEADEGGLATADAKVAMKTTAGTTKLALANQDTDLLTALKDLTDAIKAITVSSVPIDNPAVFDTIVTELEQLLYSP